MNNWTIRMIVIVQSRMLAVVRSFSTGNYTQKSDANYERLELIETYLIARMHRQ